MNVGCKERKVRDGEGNRTHGLLLLVSSRHRLFLDLLLLVGIEFLGLLRSLLRLSLRLRGALLARASLFVRRETKSAGPGPRSAGK